MRAARRLGAGDRVAVPPAGGSGRKREPGGRVTSPVDLIVADRRTHEDTVELRGWADRGRIGRPVYKS